MKFRNRGTAKRRKKYLFNSLTKAGAESANYPFLYHWPNCGCRSSTGWALEITGRYVSFQESDTGCYWVCRYCRSGKRSQQRWGTRKPVSGKHPWSRCNCTCVRCFEDPNVVHVDGSVDPARDIETINLELIFSDIEILERRIAKTSKGARMDKKLAKELELLEKIKHIWRTVSWQKPLR